MSWANEKGSCKGGNGVEHSEGRDWWGGDWGAGLSPLRQSPGRDKLIWFEVQVRGLSEEDRNKGRANKRLVGIGTQ
jgi:hypothetical protein